MSVSILVVDDEPDVALLFRQRFRREARDGTYVMHFANSGEGALEQLTEGIEPTLIVILSDINMPGMDGLTLLGEIKNRFPELPVHLAPLRAIARRGVPRMRHREATRMKLIAGATATFDGEAAKLPPP